MNYISPFAQRFPVMEAIDGVTFATGCSGVKYQDRDDVLLALLHEKTTVAGVVTKNTLCGAPIEWTRHILPRGKARALIVNAGNANVLTPNGYEVTQAIAQSVADHVACQVEDVFVASTGVIGEVLDPQPIANLVPQLIAEADDNHWEAATYAMMTTDTFPKALAKRVQIGECVVTINAIIKGSGMIAPDMATMLGYVFTDACVTADVMQQWLDEDVKKSYNCMTVDSDSSTSDMVLMFATNQAEHSLISDPDDLIAQPLREAFAALHKELAKLVCKDGEGISHFVTVQVTGGETDKSAHRIARAIADSPLVKTAIAGSDPNWGRIAMAIGKTGERINRKELTIGIGGNLIASEGMRDPDYDEQVVVDYMQNKEITLHVDVGVGRGTATIWTSDLTHEYISINVDYRS